MFYVKKNIDVFVCSCICFRKQSVHTGILYHVKDYFWPGQCSQLFHTHNYKRWESCCKSTIETAFSALIVSNAHRKVIQARSSMLAGI